MILSLFLSEMKGEGGRKMRQKRREAIREFCRETGDGISERLW
jgi:hypothetical protein